MYYSVKKVKHYSVYKLKLLFENGEEKIFDMEPYLDKGVFKALKDIEMFKTVRVSFDTIEWANQADFDPEVLYEKSEKLE